LTINDLMWFVSGLSIIGTVLNIKKKRSSFIIWLVSNCLWFAYDLYIGAYAQSALFLVYIGLAIWGIASWRKK
jgi:nicotinamide riboside transporter PnuC